MVLVTRVSLTPTFGSRAPSLNAARIRSAQLQHVSGFMSVAVCIELPCGRGRADDRFNDGDQAPHAALQQVTRPAHHAPACEIEAQLEAGQQECVALAKTREIRRSPARPGSG